MAQKPCFLGDNGDLGGHFFDFHQQTGVVPPPTPPIRKIFWEKNSLRAAKIKKETLQNRITIKKTIPYNINNNNNKQKKQENLV